MPKLEKIYLEITNRCNLSCSFCLTPLRNPETMTKDGILRILPQIKERASSVSLHVLGEPLLHPKFDTLCDLFTSWEVPVQITTNGTLLHNKMETLLKQNSIRQINISVHALDSRSLSCDSHKYFIDIYQFCCEAQINRPDLYLNLRFWNYDELKNSPAFDFFQSLFNFDVSKIDLKRKKSFHLQNRLYLHFDSRFQWPSMAHPVRSKKGYCYGLTSHCGILANGDVVPCCLDGNGEIVLGNCFVTPLDIILSSPRAQNMRAHFDKGELIEPLCRRCNFISRFDNKARRSAGKNKS